MKKFKAIPGQGIVASEDITASYERNYDFGNYGWYVEDTGELYVETPQWLRRRLLSNQEQADCAFYLEEFVELAPYDFEVGQEEVVFLDVPEEKAAELADLIHSCLEEY